ncbi:MAG: hypothetical protein OXQ28_03420 [Acidobacteriota bacterium]|nr:hypothetical protein [Acidobacteriota bacterium]
MIAYFNGDDGEDVEWLDQALALKQAVLPPVVLTEILSDPVLDPAVADLIGEICRSSRSVRASGSAPPQPEPVLAKRLRARLADTLIAQSCIDSRTPLITRDRDFRHFSTHAGLDLL